MASTLGQLANSQAVRDFIRKELVDEFGEEAVLAMEANAERVTGTKDPFGELRQRLFDEPKGNVVK